MNSHAFPVHLMREPDGGYFITCPILAGCHSQGDTLEEALSNIREAIELTLEDMAAHDEPIPDVSRVLHTTVLVEA